MEKQRTYTMTCYTHTLHYTTHTHTHYTTHIHYTHTHTLHVWKQAHTQSHTLHNITYVTYTHKRYHNGYEHLAGYYKPLKTDDVSISNFFQLLIAIRQ